MMRDNAALLDRVREGDKQAEKILVENNMGLVHSIAKRYTGRGTETEDLSQIGAIGLIKAIKKFNPDFNVQFSTYAVPMIAGEIKRYLRDDGAVKISRKLKENAIKGWRCAEMLVRKLGREPTISEISKESGIEADCLVEAFDAAAPPESLYESVYDSGEKEINLIDMLSGGEIEDKVLDKVTVDTILSSLDERERQIIVLRYFKCRTQSEIAEIIGVSQVQISRIEKKVIEKIRNKFGDKKRGCCV